MYVDHFYPLLPPHSPWTLLSMSPFHCHVPPLPLSLSFKFVLPARIMTVPVALTLCRKSYCSEFMSAAFIDTPLPFLNWFN